MSDRKHDTQAKAAIGRRAFIRKTGLGAGALGAAAAALGGKAASAASDQAKPGAYRETEHVKAYYKLAKF
ncbi:MAG: formate dehydrogenase [Rhodospirillales bacterium]